MGTGARLQSLTSFMSTAPSFCRRIHGWDSVSNMAAVTLVLPSSPRSLFYATKGKLRSIHTDSRPQPAYPGHIPLTPFENSFLAVGSALMSLIDTRRAGGST